MVLGVITLHGRRCPPMFSSLGRECWLRCTKRSCGTILVDGWKPVTLKSKYVWTQDPARCCTVKKVSQYCKTNFTNIWPADFSAPSSADLNPLDIAGYGVLEHYAIKTSHLNSVSLKAAICEGGTVSSGHVLVQTYISFCQCVEANIARVRSYWLEMFCHVLLISSLNLALFEWSCQALQAFKSES